MRALLFADWIVVRSSLRRCMVAAGAVALLMLVTAISDPPSDAGELAGEVHGAIVATISLMLSFFMPSSLFGADEREGWEAARLALPLTRRQVVRARYVSLCAVVMAMTLASSVFAGIVSALATWWKAGIPICQPLGDSLMLGLVIVIAFLLFSALEVPLFFRQGITRARIFFTFPFLFCMLASIEPARSMLGVAGEAGMRVVDQLGSPWPLAGAALAFAVGAYLLSFIVSCHLYAQRDL